MAPLAEALGINLTSLGEIKEDHALTRHLVAELQQTCSEGSWSARRAHRVAELLRRVRDQLGVQFGQEDENVYRAVPAGSLDESAEQSELREEAARLRFQHEYLYQEACDLAREAQQRAASADGEDAASLAGRVRSFCNGVIDHEMREGDLVMHGVEVEAA